MKYMLCIAACLFLTSVITVHAREAEDPKAAAKLLDEMLLEQFDVNGDGKLSPVERKKAEFAKRKLQQNAKFQEGKKENHSGKKQPKDALNAHQENSTDSKTPGRKQSSSSNRQKPSKPGDLSGNFQEGAIEEALGSKKTPNKRPGQKPSHRHTPGQPVKGSKDMQQPKEAVGPFGIKMPPKMEGHTNLKRPANPMSAGRGTKPTGSNSRSKPSHGG